MEFGSQSVALPQGSGWKTHVENKCVDSAGSSTVCMWEVKKTQQPGTSATGTTTIPSPVPLLHKKGWEFCALMGSDAVKL